MKSLLENRVYPKSYQYALAGKQNRLRYVKTGVRVPFLCSSMLSSVANLISRCKTLEMEISTHKHKYNQYPLMLLEQNTFHQLTAAEIYFSMFRGWESLTSRHQWALSGEVLLSGEPIAASRCVFIPFEGRKALISITISLNDLIPTKSPIS